jgi:proline dehydrogenase
MVLYHCLRLFVQRTKTNMKRQSVHKRIIEEILRTINASADFEDGRDALQNGYIGRRTWVSVKLTAILPNAQSLINLDSFTI